MGGAAGWKVDFADAVVRGATVTHQGEITWPPPAKPVAPKGPSFDYAARASELNVIVVSMDALRFDHTGLGGGYDALMRAVGAKMTEAWGQPTIVDSKPGASGSLAVSLPVVLEEVAVMVTQVQQLGSQVTQEVPAVVRPVLQELEMVRLQEVAVELRQLVVPEVHRQAIAQAGDGVSDERRSSGRFRQERGNVAIGKDIALTRYARLGNRSDTVAKATMMEHMAHASRIAGNAIVGLTRPAFALVGNEHHGRRTAGGP